MGVRLGVFQIREVRRLELGWGCAVVGELAGVVALVVYAFAEGGAGLVGVYGLSRTLPAAIVAPLAMGLSDRIPREQLLLWATTARAVFLALAAVAATIKAPSGLVVGLAAASSMLASTYRPLLVAILPWLARSPAELAAVNVVATTMESSGALAGPVVAALLLAAGRPQAAIGVAAGFLALSALLLRGVHLPREQNLDRPSEGSLLEDIYRGLIDLGRVAPPAGMAVLIFAQTFVRGALSVLVVLLAVDVLHAGQPAVGWLYAAMGVGGLLGGAVAAAVVRANRLGRCFLVGLLLWGLPLVALAPAPGLVACVVAFAAIGIGNAVQDVGGGTLTPRLFGPRALGRVLGAEELIVFAGGGLGAAVGVPIIAVVGPRGTLAVLGAGLVVLVAGYAVRFLQIDRDQPVAGAEADLLRSLPMFAPLPLAVVEVLATRLRPAGYPADAIVVREGDPGDDFQVIAAGRAAVTVGGVSRRTLGPGDGFGEIALLRNVPRTATVTALEPLRTLALARDDFLATVTGNPTSAASAEELARGRLSGDPPAAQLGE